MALIYLIEIFSVDGFRQASCYVAIKMDMSYNSTDVTIILTLLVNAAGSVFDLCLIFFRLGQSTTVEDIRTFEVTSGSRCSESHPVTSRPAPASAAAAAAVTEEATSTQSQDEEDDDEEQSPPIFSKRAQLKYQTTDGVQHVSGKCLENMALKSKNFPTFLQLYGSPGLTPHPSGHKPSN